MKHIPMIIATILLATSYTLWKQNHKLKEDIQVISHQMTEANTANVDSLQVVIDSLTQDSWNLQRYIIAEERLKEENEACYEKFVKQFQYIE